jgi:TolA-binding protein
MRAICFASVLAVSCGSPREAATVEIAPLPLPTQTASAQIAPPKVEVAKADDVDNAQDLRVNHPRQQALVVTETQALEQLLAATAQTSPDRPQVLRRLAENYVELRKGGMLKASQKAIERYTTLTSEYPSHAKSDEALYYLALEYETVSDMTNARRSYYTVIKNYPSSSFIPYTYYAFGELFLREAASDPSKWDFAKQAYTETIKYSASPIVPEAWYKLMTVFKAQGDVAHAEQAKQKLLHDYAQSPAAARL